MHRAGIWTFAAVVIAAVFAGQIVAPALLIYILGFVGINITQYLSQGSISLGLISFSLVGLLFTSILLVPFLLWFGKETHQVEVAHG